MGKVETEERDDLDEESDSVPTDETVSSLGSTTRCSLRSLKSSDRNFCQASPSAQDEVSLYPRGVKGLGNTHWMAG